MTKKMLPLPLWESKTPRLGGVFYHGNKPWCGEAVAQIDLSPLGRPIRLRLLMPRPSLSLPVATNPPGSLAGFWNREAIKRRNRLMAPLGFCPRGREPAGTASRVRADTIRLEGLWSIAARALTERCATMASRIDCITKPALQDHHSHITNVGGVRPTGVRFYITREECASDIVNRRETYFVHVGTAQITVEAYQERGIWFIKTRPDYTQKDNLLSLPQCR
jgi:Protein of unknown function (DUF3892)